VLSACIWVLRLLIKSAVHGLAVPVVRLQVTGGVVEAGGSVFTAMMACLISSDSCWQAPTTAGAVVGV
jgi:hypothetical protein